jgi:hypothetical protein
MEPLPGLGVYSALERRALPFGKPFPADIGKTPLQGFLFARKGPVMRGIILWLLGVPVVVIIGLYLFHVI